MRLEFLQKTWFLGLNIEKGGPPNEMKAFSSKKLSEDEIKQLRQSAIYPFVLDKTSVCYVSRDKEGNRTLVWISSRIEILASVLHEESQTIFSKLKIHTKFGDKEIVVDRGVFTSRRIDELRKFGVDFDPKHAAKLIKFAVISEQNVPAVNKYTNCGWNRQGNFCGFDEGYEGSLNLSLHQSTDHYLSVLNKLIKDSLGCQLIVSVSLSSATLALLQDQLHTDTIICHVFGDSSKGKTSGLHLAASMWGSPEPGEGTFQTWNATSNAMLSALNGNFGVCMCFDESGAIPKRDYTSLIYCISQGIDRARLTKDAQKKIAKRWNTIVLSSGESSLLDASNQNSGLRARVLEFLNTPITRSASHAEKIKTLSYSNYGILGRQWVEILKSTALEELLEIHDGWQKLLLDELNSDSNLIKRLCSVAGVILVTAELAEKKLGLAIDTSSLAEFFYNHLKALDRESLSLAQRVYETLLEWISENPHLIQNQNESGDGGKAAKMMNPTEIAIRSTVFKKILEEHGFSDVRVAAKALKEAGLLRPEARDGLQCRIVFGKVKVQTYRILLKHEWLGR